MKNKRRAWIIGNIITFKKPTYKSAFFGIEEVMVTTVKEELKKLPKIVEEIYLDNKKIT